jgi:hypothetical protein
MAALSGWVAGHRGAAVTLEIEGETLMLDATATQERPERLEVFMDRHGGS